MMSAKQKQSLAFVQQLIKLMHSNSITSLEVGEVKIIAGIQKEKFVRKQKPTPQVQDKIAPIIRKDEIAAMKKEELIKLATYSVSNKKAI